MCALCTKRVPMHVQDLSYHTSTLLSLKASRMSENNKQIEATYPHKVHNVYKHSVVHT